jgi:phenylalanyl-tRNA synthetase beta chain
VNVSKRWLEELLGRPLEAEELVERFAMLGAPVDAVEPLGAGLEQVVVGEVLRVERHPNADRLWLCSVAAGAEPLEVVCGAPIVVAGKKYPFAPVGATLPGGLTLERRKIRGTYSNGMLCSERELELGEDAAGILELDTNAPAGTGLSEALGLDDHRLVLDVAANRADLHGMRGVARELGAVLGATVRLPGLSGAPTSPAGPPRRVADVETVVDGVRVAVEDVDGAPRYLIAVVRGVMVGPSPAWLEQRLRAIGQRSINNVVDATNYVMFELNQPTHAFDLAKLRGPAVVVRRARREERIVTLDGTERVLDEEMTAICDSERPTIIGGVMGSSESEVDAGTQDLVIECAAFEPKRIRRTRKNVGLITESSYRFERGVDQSALPEALHRLLGLIIAVAGGEVREAPVDFWPRPAAQRSVFLRPSRVAHVLGIDVARPEIETVLGSIGCVALPKDTDRMAVQVPSWRPDLVDEIDLIEEVARIRGYDTIPEESRPQRLGTVPDAPIEALAGRLRVALAGDGLYEAVSMPLGAPGGGDSVPVVNPLATTESHLRTALLPGLVRRVEHNWAQRERNVRLFEIGTAFFPNGEEGLPREETRVAAVVTGARRPAHWTEPRPPDTDAWDARGLLARVARLAWPGAALHVAGSGWESVDEVEGVVGWARPLEADAPSWAGAVYGLEMRLSDSPSPAPTFRPMPMTPPVERDVALVVPGGATALQIEGVIRSRAGPLLESLVVFDEFRGAELPAGTRSVGFRLTFRDPARTLREAEADAALERALEALEVELGVRRR